MNIITVTKMASVFKYFCERFVEIETALRNNLLQRFLPGNFCPAFVNLPDTQTLGQNSSLKEILHDSFLLAVPKHRRSVEKKRTRKFGHSKYGYKILIPKNYILTCWSCGSHFEAGTLCRKCYEKVMEETKEMQEKIKEKLGISPVENEVIVLYEGEEHKRTKFGKESVIVEMKKPRPSFFSKNLLQRSTETCFGASGVSEGDEAKKKTEEEKSLEL